MVSKICLDTDVLVNLLRNKLDALEYVQKNEEESVLATTYINVFELYLGAYSSRNVQQNIQSVNALLKRITILNLSDESVNSAGKILARLKRSGVPIDMRDLLIGTIALASGHKIKTYNTAHFARIEGLELA